MPNTRHFLSFGGSVNRPALMGLATTFGLLLLTGQPSQALTAAKTDPACADHTPGRQAFFGDLHIHTGVSADAMLFGTKNRPDDAYAFARGKEIQVRQSKMIPDRPLAAQLERPLDFAAVTDHAENIGTVSLCMTPGTAVYDSKECRFVRAPLPTDDMARFSSELTKVFHTMYTSEVICGADRTRCIEAVAKPWQEIQTSAHQWNNACAFTTFVGYEYSPTERGANLHHNVIFRSDQVTATPISSRDVPDPFAFYAKLKSECNDAGNGCEAIAIPHNSNISNGRMFRLGYDADAPLPRKREIAKTRAEIVRLVEIFQEKGDSECRNGLWNVLGQADEFCDFEKYRDWKGAEHEDCENQVGAGGFQNKGCVSRVDYTRYALAAGLAEERRIGINPLKFGVVAATDNHMGTAADLEEWVHDGKQRPVSLIEPGRMSTGGIAGVWAEENTRASIYAAMKRRETFGTSGPRIQPRFFGGWDLPSDLCDDPKMIEKAYETGVPMGADLSSKPPQRKPLFGKPKANRHGPSFLVSALQDPGTPKHPGTPLQRIQIVKVWAGENNELHQAVYDVAGRDNGASVNTNTCERSSSNTNARTNTDDTGSASLCAVWQDPDYDSSLAAAYYARVLEDPSCRHTAYACLRAEPDAAPAYCEDERVTKEIQERAWTSPIWVEGRR